MPLRYPLTKTAATFIAIVLPPEIQKFLSQLQLQLDIYKFPVTWELPDKFHLSLAYLGRIGTSETQTATKILTQSSKTIHQFSLSLGHLDYFYQKHDHGIIWIKASDPDNNLVDFHKQLVKDLNHQGFSVSDKKLLPHITLGRLKRLDKNSQMDILHTLTDHPLPALPASPDASQGGPSFNVNSLHLLTSHYSRNLNTTEYQIAQEFKLTTSSLD